MVQQVTKGRSFRQCKKCRDNKRESIIRRAKGMDHAMKEPKGEPTDMQKSGKVVL